MIKLVRSVVGNILHLARLIKYKLIYAIGPGITVGSLASKQASGQSSNITEADQLINYIHTNPLAKLRLWASDMYLRSSVTILTSQITNPSPAQ